jgi:hypothetical protein
MGSMNMEPLTCVSDTMLLVIASFFSLFLSNTSGFSLLELLASVFLDFTIFFKKFFDDDVIWISHERVFFFLHFGGGKLQFFAPFSSVNATASWRLSDSVLG